MRPSITACLLALALGGRAAAESTIDPAHRYAYGEDIGWMDWYADGTNGAVVTENVCSGYLYSANCGWISLGSGQPANGIAYGNASADDFGVNHDGTGRLSGYAYGANIGWIVFEASGAPRIDQLTGNLSGYVYGANTGWISLSNAFAHVRTRVFAAGADTDGDGIPDAWERTKAGGLDSLSRTNDLDRDGFPDTSEYLADTNPLDSSDCLRVTAAAGAEINEALIEWRSSPTRLYRIETAADLTAPSPWADCGLGLLSPDSGLSSVRPVGIASNAPAFFRVKAMRPLTP